MVRCTWLSAALTGSFVCRTRYGDGQADAVIAVVINLPGLHSLTWHSNPLYAAGNATVRRLHDDDADGIFSSNEITAIVTGLPTSPIWLTMSPSVSTGYRIAIC